MTLSDVEYVTVEQAAIELALSKRQIRNLCAEYDWFGKKMGKTWVITRLDLDKMKITARRGPGRPQKRIGDS